MLWAVLLLLSLRTNSIAQESKSLFSCPMGIGSLDGDSPKISNQYQPGNYVYACGFNEDDESSAALESSGPIIMNGFEIYSFNEKTKNPKRIKTVAAIEKHQIEKTVEGLSVIDIIPIGKTEYRTLKTEVKCQDGECKVEKPTCIFKRLKDVPANRFREFKRHYNGSKRNKVPNESIIEGAGLFALSANAEAIELFLRNPPPVRLEGGSKEIFQRYSWLIRSLRDNRCF